MAQNGSSQSQSKRHSSVPPQKRSYKSQHNRPALTVTSLNAEGFSKEKASLLSDLCRESHCDVLCIQETHRDHTQQRPSIAGMTLVAEIPHRKYGSAVFIKSDIVPISTSCSNINDIEIITVDIKNCTITSIYKPPSVPFTYNQTKNYNDSLVNIVIGDFNSHSTSWGYSDTNADGDAVEEWAEAKGLTLIHDAKLPSSFNSARWRRGYNPDLIFASNNISALCKKEIESPIPHTQHRPISCKIFAAIKPSIVPYRPRFNFRKADWKAFSESIDSKLVDLEPTSDNYNKFIKIIRVVSRKTIPRGCRTSYIPGLNKNYSNLLKQYQSSFEKDPFSEDTLALGEELTKQVGEHRRETWMNLVSSVDMTHNSKQAWRTIRKLTDDPPSASNPGPVTANQVAHQLLINGKPSHRIHRQPKLLPNSFSPNSITKPLTITEIVNCIKGLRNGKAAGVDDLTTEQIKNLGPTAVSWLLALFNSCLETLKIPKPWRKSRVIALLKPGKCPNDAKSYRPISLLCHTFKLFERILLNRLTTALEPQLIPEQAGFRPGKSCTGQTLALTQFIEDGFERQQVTGAVFVDLSAAYDTVNIKRLLVKVHETTKDTGFVQILREILGNRRFQVHLNSTKSRWRNLRNGLPQGSVLAPTLFNIYTNDQPILQNTRHFLYADDLALTTQSPSFEDAEQVLTSALETLDQYYVSNGLRPNPSKTQSCAFHLRNRQANRALKISWQGVNIEHCPHPRYLGITLDRSLTYKPHCHNLKRKIGTRNNLLRRLTSSSWGAAPHVLRTTGLALSYTTGEYACPVWHRSAHAKEVDTALNETCRIITGCLKPTPLNLLYPLAGIAPPRVRRQVACETEKLLQETDPRHPLFGHSAPPARLKSRKSFIKATNGIPGHPKEVKQHLWSLNCPVPPDFIQPVEKLPAGHELQWASWVTLNRLRTGVGRCRSNLVKWGYSAESECDCGAPIQDMVHLLSCPLCPINCTREDLIEVTDAALSLVNFWTGKI